MRAATILMAAPAQDPYHRGLSLLHGWVVPTVEVVAAVILILAIGWRTRRWRFLRVPVGTGVGVAAVAAAHWYMDSQGMAGEPAPQRLWIWIGLSGLAVAVLLLGWTSARWWRRGVSLLAIPLCLVSAGLALNLWVGYFPTVQAAWNHLTAGPLPDETDMATVTAMKATGTVPSKGAVVPVAIPDTASGFKHRTELVYLPPAWFARGAPKLPTVMMIGGEFNTPGDWLRTGNAISTIDGFAAAHAGNAPVLVFVDSGGSFNNDTECVSGPRGNVADHLTKDVVPYLSSTFGVSPASANWGIVGWSMGGTCAVDLTVMHPDLFSSFVDIAGDMGPTAGTKEQTISRLFGGDAGAWAAFDPTTVIERHGPYAGVSGWFAISGDPPTPHRGNPANDDAVGLHGRDAGMNPGDQTQAANTLCALGRSDGIACMVVAAPGKHDWPFATQVFATSLPWLAGQLGTPAAPKVALPNWTPPPAQAPTPVSTH